jgi:hypothetical protein
LRSALSYFLAREAYNYIRNHGYHGLSHGQAVHTPPSTTHRQYTGGRGFYFAGVGQFTHTTRPTQPSQHPQTTSALASAPTDKAVVAKPAAASCCCAADAVNATATTRTSLTLTLYGERVQADIQKAMGAVSCPTHACGMRGRIGAFQKRLQKQTTPTALQDCSKASTGNITSRYTSTVERAAAAPHRLG